MKRRNEHEATRRTVIIAGAVNILAGLVKLVAGILTGSSAMLAEAASYLAHDADGVGTGKTIIAALAGPETGAR